MRFENTNELRAAEFVNDIEVAPLITVLGAMGIDESADPSLAETIVVRETWLDVVR